MFIYNLFCIFRMMWLSLLQHSEIIIFISEYSSRWDCILHVWEYKLMQTLRSFTRIHSDLSLQLERQKKVSLSPYQDPLCYLKAASCCTFLSAREMQPKVKVLILCLPEQSFSNWTILVISFETSESWKRKSRLSVSVVEISSFVSYNNF